MRSITKNSVVAGMAIAGLVTALSGFAPVITAAHAGAHNETQPKGGVTITPATLTLTLAKGAKQQTATFSIANDYSAAVALHLSFAQPVAAPGSKGSALKQLSILPADVSIPPGQTAKQTILLTDSDALAPGSQQAELVVSQLTASGDHVSIVPSVHMPLSIIKLDGAVTKLDARDIVSPGFALRIPEGANLTIANTGNMIAIPRGYASVRDPRGREISKGVINMASAAVTPGSQLRVSAALTSLDHAWLPGMYHVQVHYGLGGNAASQTASASFFYLPVWHMLLVVLFGSMVYCGWQIRREVKRLKQQKRQTKAKPAGAASPDAARRKDTA